MSGPREKITVEMVPTLELNDVLMRHDVDARRLEDVRRAHRHSTPLPPIIVHVDPRTKRRLLADGHHRLTVARQDGIEEIEVRFVESVTVFRRSLALYEEHANMVERTLRR